MDMANRRAASQLSLCTACFLAALSLAHSLAPGLPTITAVDPSRFPILTDTAFSLTLSLRWPTDGNAGADGGDVDLLHCRVYRADAQGNFTDLLYEGEVSTEDDYGYLATSVSLDGLVMKYERNQFVKVLCYPDSTFTADEPAELEKKLWCVPGGLTLMPPLLGIVLTVLTQNVLVSLFIGTWSGAFIRYKYHPFQSLLYTQTVIVANAFSDLYHILVILFSWFLAGMVGILCRMGGGYGLAESVAKHAKTRLSTQLVIFAMGWIIFFDDYTNSLLVGMTMRPISDAMRISREKLAYLVDSSSAPVASLAPVSSWVGFEVSLIKDAFATIEDAGADMSAYDKPYIAFLKTIPSRFYPLFVLFLQFFLICTNREFGPMLWAERRAMRTGKLTADNANVAEIKINNELEPKEGVPRRWWNAIIPIAVTVGMVFMALLLTGYNLTKELGDPITGYNVFGNGDSFKSLVWATFAGSVTAWVLASMQWHHNGELFWPSWLRPLRMFKTHPAAKPLLTGEETYNVWVEGVKSLTGAILTLILAWSIGDSMELCGTGEYISNGLKDTLDYRAVPTVSFILSAIISTCTGTSWGTMTIMFPISIPTIWKMRPGDNDAMLLTISSILAGSVFGDHITYISDTTILSCLACLCDIRHHVHTQVPYAVFAMVVSLLIGYIPSGYKAWPGWAGWLIGMPVLAVLAWLVSVPVEGDREDIVSRALLAIGSRFGYKKPDDGSPEYASSEDTTPPAKPITEDESYQLGSKAVV